MQQFYAYLDKVGYNYAKPFQASAVDRHLDHAVVTLPVPPESKVVRASMHPVVLDTAIQGILAAFSFPEDGRRGSIYLPTAIDCVRVNMAPPNPASSPGDAGSGGGGLLADSFLTSADAKALVGDVNIFSTSSDGDDAANVQVQMRGVRWTALSAAESECGWLYAGETWVRETADGIEPGLQTVLAPETEELRVLLVRTAHFFLRRLRDTIKPAELMLMGKQRRHMMRWVREHLMPQVEAGKHPEIQAAWASDTLADVQRWSEPYLAAGNNDMRLLHAVGTNLAPIARGTMPALQVLIKDGMLDRLYMEGVGFKDGNVDLKRLVAQLAHRYPRMKVLEVGAGTGGTTCAVLEALGDYYTSYMYTDVSAGFFEPAKAKFSQQHADGRLGFKMLNIEKDPVDQGFEQVGYDLVVASNCLHATSSLRDTLRHCRGLLRPGGYLVLLEITRDHLPIQLIMGTLPGWFLGADDGRIWAPTVGLDQWDALLRETGFSGVDASSTPSFCSVIMSQATDDTVQVLRDPLPVGGVPPVDQILIIGGGSEGGAASELAFRSQALLSSCCGEGSVVRWGGGVEGLEVPCRAAVLCLCDLDSLIFDDMTQARFEAVQNVFRNASAVLWVTSGAASGKQPVANVTVGLGRTLLAELSDLRLQFLDVDMLASLEPSMLVTLLLRLAWMSRMPDLDEKILWNHEPQLALRNGALYIPRVLALDDISRRSTARNRQVTQSTTLDLLDTDVQVTEQHDGSLELIVQRVASLNAGELRVQVTAPSLCAVICDADDESTTIPASAIPWAYLWLGHEMESGDNLVGLSRANSSIVTVTAGQILHRWRPAAAGSTMVDADSDDAAQLHHFMQWALATCILRGLTGPVWVHGAPKGLSQAIARVVHEQGLAVFQTTSDLDLLVSGVQQDDHRSFIHPYISERDLQSLCPRNVETFINLEPLQNRALSLFIRNSLPCSTVLIDLDVGDLTIRLSRSELCKLAKQHFEVSITNSDTSAHHGQILPIEIVSRATAKGSGAAAVINWRTVNSVTTSIRPVEYKELFSPEKTYLLFGMTGDVGISIARWMVEHGARNIVLASRNPRVPHGVMDYFVSQKGASLRAMAVDITNKEALRAAYAEIKSCMPPVGGVINGAMVLRDRLFLDMSWVDFAAVLAPKVAGTQNLDKVFEENEAALDFFIVLSSATSFVGTLGQSAYSAANHFMASLVRGRWARGLPGSVVVIGFLTGLGYILRSEKAHLAAIEKSLLPRLARQSETDLHDMLAQAIVCGRPDGSNSDQPAELITGVRTSFQEAWHEDPRLSCYLARDKKSATQEGTAGAEQQGNGANVRVETQLKAATDPKEGLAVLEKCFTQALGNMLQLDPA